MWLPWKMAGKGGAMKKRCASLVEKKVTLPRARGRGTVGYRSGRGAVLRRVWCLQKVICTRLATPRPPATKMCKAWPNQKRRNGKAFLRPHANCRHGIHGYWHRRGERYYTH